MPPIGKSAKIHPYAELFPVLSGNELKDLAEDIKTNGQQHPIILDQSSRVVDGRSRQEACSLVGVEPLCETREFTDEEALSFVISMNLRRRHLNESQRGMIAAEIANMERGGYEGNKNAMKNESLNSVIRFGEEQVTSDEELSEEEGKPPKISQSQAAEMMNVSTDTVNKAKKVKTKGTPKLKEAVKEGKMSVNRAAKVADEPAEEQDKEVERVEQGVKAESKEEETPSDDTDRSDDTGKSGDTNGKALRWAVMCSKVDAEKLSEKFGNKPLHWKRFLSSLLQGVGFYVTDVGDGEYRVRRAAHYPIAHKRLDKPDVPPGMKEELQRLREMATHARDILNGRTSMRWTEDEQNLFLSEVERVLKPFND